MRTSVPHVTYTPAPLSVTGLKEEVWLRRRASAAATSPPSVSAYLAVLRTAATRLHAGGATSFTPDELLDEALRADPTRLEHTLRYTLATELQRPDAVVVQHEPGRLGVRPAPAVTQVRPAAGGRLSSELVLQALRDLAPDQTAAAAGVSAQELWTHLAAQGHYYEVSGIYRCLRRALAAGTVTASGRRPRRFVPA